MKKLPKEHQFLGEKWVWEADFDSTFPQLITVVTKFCELGLLLTFSDPLMLHATLCFFEMVSVISFSVKFSNGHDSV